MNKASSIAGVKLFSDRVDMSVCIQSIMPHKLPLLRRMLLGARTAAPGLSRAHFGAAQDRGQRGQLDQEAEHN